MQFLADLHVHSHLSRATSRNCTLEGLHRAAQLKGIQVVGTGDCTHPEWLQEIRTKLEPTENGLFRLRHDFREPAEPDAPHSCQGDVQFLVTGEISSIYKRADAVRKVHSVVFMPDIEAAETLFCRLDAIGNVRSDGRPILGLDARDLLGMLLDISPESMLVPAHIWTPWFAMMGSKSGFDSPDECFGDLVHHVTAIETGLSSDPPMNWRLSTLDRFRLLSFSDLHSPANLGRNATVFLGPPAFTTIRDALVNPESQAYAGTIDMFPEAGKYHFDGHRKCGVCLHPEESRARNNQCPVCSKPLTLGVLHRVVALADRPRGAASPRAGDHEYIIPLPEIIAEIVDCGVKTKKVARACDRLINEHGPEMTILRTVDPESVRLPGLEALPEALRRLRSSQVIREPGFDGEYGRVHLFKDGEIA